MASDHDSVLMQDFKMIEKKFSESPSFSLAEIRMLFSDTNPKTVGWKIYKMAERGLLRRESHGYYSLQTEEKKTSEEFVHLSTQAKKNLYHHAKLRLFFLCIRFRCFVG